MSQDADVALVQLLDVWLRADGVLPDAPLGDLAVVAQDGLIRVSRS